jgi:hypothetical protein
MRRSSLLIIASFSFLAGEPTASGRRGDAFLETSPVGPLTPPSRGPHAGSHGGTLLADAHGLLVVERSAGLVLRSGPDGAARAQVALHPGLGEIVGDGKGMVFVADRAADRIVRLSPGDAAGTGLAIAGELALTEPHGLALTPDGATLLVTSVADHQLLAVDTATLKIRWRVELAPEPRGVAVTSDGASAIVGFLASGALAVVDLASAGKRVRWQSLNPRDQIDVEVDEEDDGMPPEVTIREARSRYQVPTSTGKRYARVFPTIALVGGDRVIVPHQVETPQLVRTPDEHRSDTYGGLTEAAPIEHHMAMLRWPGAPQAESLLARLDVHQPRALAYDLDRDTLFVGGYGDDRVIAIADVSQQAPYVLWRDQLANSARDACGIDGLVVAGERLWAHCELTHRLASIAHAPRLGVPWTMGPVLTPETRGELVARGAELFRRGGDPKLSAEGVMACASCHPEGRNDGLTWRLGPSILQTPILAGRVTGTAPFKWDGQDPDLQTSLHHTIGRLGGQPDRLSKADLAALKAFIAALPRPRPRAALDADAVARGRTLFTSDALGCDACHTGATLSDGGKHAIKGSLPMVDTPSLIGLGHSAPYYHDGSADSLASLVSDKASVHDMVDPSVLTALSRQQSSDLVAYLGSL